MNNEALNYGADRRRGYKNISSTDVPGLQDGHTKNTYYYQNVNNNNEEYESMQLSTQELIMEAREQRSKGKTESKCK